MDCKLIFDYHLNSVPFIGTAPKVISLSVALCLGVFVANNFQDSSKLRHYQNFITYKFLRKKLQYFYLYATKFV